MKVIIAGGRNYNFTKKDFDKLKILHEKYTFTKVLSGCATGADRGGEIFAKNNNISLSLYPEDWKRFGKAAGPLRNEQMARNADALIVFPG